MSRISLYMLPVLALTFAACDENESGGSTPAKASATTPATAKSAKAAPTKPTKPKKVKKTEKKKEAKWEKFPGPKVKADIGDAKNVWCALPVSDGFDILKFGYKSVKKAEDNVVVVNGYVPSHVPAAFIHKPKEDLKLKKGAPVMVDEAAAGPLGRVLEAGDKIKVKYMFGSSVSDTSESPAQVWPLAGKVAFAEPVAYKDGAKWSYGRVAQTDKDKTWVITGSGHVKRVDTSSVKPLEINTIYKKGDSVWAVWVGGFKPAKVTEVVDDGVAYKVKYDEGSEEEKTVGFGKVTKPIE